MTKAYNDLCYARTEQRDLMLNLRVPQRASPPPLVLYIPMAGMRSCLRGDCDWWLTAHGFAMASIDCRVIGEGTAHAAIHDCKSAVRWLRAHAAEYGYCGTRIGVWGHSAGGLLAALLGTSGDVAELEGEGAFREQSSRVQAVCDECGVPHDLSYFSRPELKAQFTAVAENIHGYLGAAPEETPALARQLSSTTYIAADNPPMLLIHGDCDAVVPKEEMCLFHKQLLAAGVDSTLIILPDTGHGWPAQRTAANIVSFFRRTLGS